MADYFGFTLVCVASSASTASSLKAKLEELSLLNAEEMIKLGASLGVNVDSSRTCLPLNTKEDSVTYKLKQSGLKLILEYDIEGYYSFDHYWQVRNVFSTIVLSLRKIDPGCEVSIVGYDENEYDDEGLFEDDYDYSEPESIGRHSYIYKPQDDTEFYYWFVRFGEPEDFEMPSYEDVHPDFKCKELKGGKRGEPIQLVKPKKAKTKGAKADKSIREIEKALKDEELDYWQNEKFVKKTKQRGHFVICVNGIPKMSVDSFLDDLEQKLIVKAGEAFKDFDEFEEGPWGFRLGVFDHDGDDEVMLQFNGIGKHGYHWTTSRSDEATFKLIESFIDECLIKYPGAVIIGYGCFDAEADYTEWVSNNSAIVWLKGVSDSRAYFQVCLSPNSKGAQAAKLAKSTTSPLMQLSAKSYSNLLEETLYYLEDIYESLGEDALDGDAFPSKPSKSHECKYIFPTEF